MVIKVKQSKQVVQKANIGEKNTQLGCIFKAFSFLKRILCRKHLTANGLQDIRKEVLSIKTGIHSNEYFYSTYDLAIR